MGDQGGETWVVGPGCEKILLLSRGQSGGGGGRQDSPRGWGDEHDPKLQGKATSPKVSRHRVGITTMRASPANCAS